MHPVTLTFPGVAWKFAVAPTPPKEPLEVLAKEVLATVRARMVKMAPPAEEAWQSEKEESETETSRDDATAPPTMRNE